MQPVKLLTNCAILILFALQSQGCSPAVKSSFENFLTELDKSMQKTARRILKDEKETKDSLNYDDSKGLLLAIRDFTVHPKKVKKGESVHLSVQYSILGAKKSGVQINDIKTLWNNNQKIATLAEETLKQKNGTWESTLTFMAPASAQKGTYKIKQIIATYNQEAQSEVFFTITN